MVNANDVIQLLLGLIISICGFSIKRAFDQIDEQTKEQQKLRESSQKEITRLTENSTREVQSIRLDLANNYTQKLELNQHLVRIDLTLKCIESELKVLNDAVLVLTTKQKNDS